MIDQTPSSVYGSMIRKELKKNPKFQGKDLWLVPGRADQNLPLIFPPDFPEDKKDDVQRTLRKRCNRCVIIDKKTGKIILTAEFYREMHVKVLDYIEEPKGLWKGVKGESQTGSRSEKSSSG